MTAIYKGHDYAELYPALGISTDASAERAKERMGELIGQAMGREDGPEAEPLRFFATELRSFLTALAEQEDKAGYSAPLWRGFTAITDDETMVRLFIPILEGAWS